MEFTHEYAKVEVLSGTNVTYRWTGRRGEFIVRTGIDYVSKKQWYKLNRLKAPFFGTPLNRKLLPDEVRWGYRDIWELRDGDQVMITDRWQDLPSWIQLSPAEVTKPILEKVPRFSWKSFPSEDFNVWRVPAGDRLIWVTANDPECSVKAIVNLETCALVVGESTTGEYDVFREFGTPQAPRFLEENDDAILSGIDLASALVARLSCEFPCYWKFGR